MQDIVDFSFQLDVRNKYHFSSQPIQGIYSIDLSQQSTIQKPQGLWYSWGGSWPLFMLTDYLRSFGQCHNAKWAKSRMEDINYIYKVDVDFTRMLRLRTCRSFKEFTVEYGRELSGEEKEEKFAKFMDFPHVINWKKVAKRYRGIDVRYNDNCTLDYHWFEHWDCHSGCIWKLSAVKDMKLVWAA